MTKNTKRAIDGSAGDVDYARIAPGYSTYRQPEPEFERAIAAALGDARTVLNVGAGAGSYEPLDREVTAVEPSATMRAQRPDHLTEAIDATAESLPFADDTFDAAMATFSIHQWPDPAAGLAELRRVTRGPIVLLTCDPERIRRGWIHDYFPEPLDVESTRYPSMARLVELLGEQTTVTPLPIPLDCVDRFTEAYWGKPEGLLDPAARRAKSAWSFVDEPTLAPRLARLEADLADGTWDAAHGDLRRQSHHEGSLVLVVG